MSNKITIQDLSQFLRSLLVSENHRFTIQCHPSYSDISELGDEIQCSEWPSDDLTDVDNSDVQISDYRFERAVEDCINLNPVNDGIISFIGDFSDTESPSNAQWRVRLGSVLQ